MPFGRMARYRREGIRGLDPRRDHQRIAHLLACYEFPWDMTRSLEFALFRTFCAPKISELLDRTGEFRLRTQKRYDDTDIIVSELLEWGYDSERGQAALRRMNQIHNRFKIANEDFLYVLSTFIYEPIRWNARFGWRLMCEQERLGLFHFWRQVGTRMGIRDIPEDDRVFEQFNVAYEAANFRYRDTNQRTGEATLEMFVSWFPKFLAPVVRSSMYAIMDDSLRSGFGFPKPSPLIGPFALMGLHLRAYALHALPARRRPRLRTEGKHRTYPTGYQIEQIGPTKP